MTNPPWRLIAHVLAGMVALTAGAVAPWRGGVVGPPIATPLERRVAEARPWYARVSMSRLDGMDSVGDVRRVFDRGAYARLGGLDDAQREALFTGAAEFLFHRFVRDDREGHKAWRRERGYEFEDRELMREGWFVDEQYDRIVANPKSEPARASPVPGATAAECGTEALFDYFYSDSHLLGRGANQPVAIADDSLGMVGVAAVVGPTSSPEPMTIWGEMPVEHWHGASAATVRGWWRRPNGEQELFATHGEALSARLGMVVQWGDALRKPFMLTYVWDPSRADWTLVSASVHNSPSRSVNIDY